MAAKLSKQEIITNGSILKIRLCIKPMKTGNIKNNRFAINDVPLPPEFSGTEKGNSLMIK